MLFFLRHGVEAERVLKQVYMYTLREKLLQLWIKARNQVQVTKGSAANYIKQSHNYYIKLMKRWLLYRLVLLHLSVLENQTVL